MATKTVEIQVQNDHLERLATVKKPILAVAELIWNAVDADADRVDIALHDGVLGGFEAIEVADNGHGMPHSEAEGFFSRLGGSWKKVASGPVKSRGYSTVRRGEAACVLLDSGVSLTGMLSTAPRLDCGRFAFR